VQKFNPAHPVSAIYVDGESKLYMVKRFMIETTTLDKEFNFISESIGSRLVVATTAESAEIEVEFISGKNKDKKTDVMSLEDLIDVKGWKAVGNRLSLDRVTKVTLVADQEDGPADSAGEDDESAGSEGDQAKKKRAAGATKQRVSQPLPKQSKSAQRGATKNPPGGKPAASKAAKQSRTGKPKPASKAAGKSPGKTAKSKAPGKSPNRKPAKPLRKPGRKK
jgi:topoisomerase-4 subunit A